jgi:hypothetical protein
MRGLRGFSRAATLGDVSDSGVTTWVLLHGVQTRVGGGKKSLPDGVRLGLALVDAAR